MIRLVLLIPTLDRSGAEKQLTLLATRLPRDDFDVHVIALSRGGPYANVLRQHEIPLTNLDKRLKFDIGAFRRLKSTLRQLQPDVLHTWLFAASAYGRLVSSSKIRPKVVVSERCVDTWKAGWQLWLDRRLISRTDWLIGNSQSVVDFYRTQGFPAERSSVISNGMDLPEESPREGEAPAEPLEVSTDASARGSAGASPSRVSRSALLKQLGIPMDARLIGFVGRLAKQKRIDDLLWAMQILRQADERCYLLIIGDGPERSRLEQHARDVECHEHVRFLGHREDATSLMRHFDVFWLGSDFEGLSNSVMEAMAHRVPVVATNIPPNRELITHGEQGYLVDVGDGVAFAQYSLKILNDEELAHRLGDAGRSRIADDFGVQKMVDAHIALYGSLMTTHHSPLTPSPP